MTGLDKAAIDKALGSLPGWAHEGGALKKKFVFENFRDAMSFMMRIAFEAEAANHHPEIRNVWATVEIALRTHDAGDVVTEMDAELAAVIEKISWV